MQPFDNIIQGLVNFKQNIMSYVDNEVERNEDEIVQISTDRIYTKGKLSDGKKIKPKNKPYNIYNPQYERKKRSLGLYQGYVDLSISGNLLGSYKISSKNGIIDFDVDDSNKDLLEILKKLYGDDITGLSQREWDFVNARYINPRLISEIIKIW